MTFKKATKKRGRARIALIGPAGTGKTYSALRIAQGLGKRIALIDSEHDTASLYSDEIHFSVQSLESFHPQKYIDAIADAEAEGFDVLIIDSLSHAWMGKDGVMELVDQEKKRGAKALSPWGAVTPLHNALIEAMLRCKCHLIVTMRSKVTYAQEEVEVDGRKRTVISKLGLQPVQRDGLEFEFDIVGDMTQKNELVVTKTRARFLSEKIIDKPSPDLGEQILTWLNASAEGPTLEERREAAKEKLRAYAVALGAERCRAIVGKSGKELETVEEMEGAVHALDRVTNPASSDLMAPPSAPPPPDAGPPPSATLLASPSSDAPLMERMRAANAALAEIFTACDAEAFALVTGRHPDQGMTLEEKEQTIEMMLADRRAKTTTNTAAQPTEAKVDLPSPAPSQRVAAPPSTAPLPKEAPKADGAQQPGPSANQAPGATQEKPANGDAKATAPALASATEPASRSAETPAGKPAEGMPPEYAEPVDMREIYQAARASGLSADLVPISRELFGKTPDKLSNVERHELLDALPTRGLLKESRRVGAQAERDLQERERARGSKGGAR